MRYMRNDGITGTYLAPGTLANRNARVGMAHGVAWRWHGDYGDGDGDGARQVRPSARRPRQLKSGRENKSPIAIGPSERYEYMQQ